MTKAAPNVETLDAGLTAADLCARWGVGKRQLGNLARRGLPTHGARRTLRFHSQADIRRDVYLNFSERARRNWRTRNGSGFSNPPKWWPVLTMRLALAYYDLRAAKREVPSS